jgi:putative flippase GtrA
MNSVVKKFKYFRPSILRWAIVGVFTNALDFLVFVVLYDKIKIVSLSNLISTALATSINYYSHHKWTFKSNQAHIKSSKKYLLNLLAWWVVSTLIIKGLVTIGIDPRIAKIVPLIFVPINYYILNHIIFKSRN